MKNIKAFKKARQPGRKRKYDWDKIFNGKVWELEWGTDFHIVPQHFALGARQMAAKMRKQLYISASNVTGLVIIQAEPICSHF